MMNQDYKDYKLYEELPILYGTEKNGKIKQWKASVYLNHSNHSNYAISFIEFGQLDGKKQTAIREYKEGKNIGKKNETTPLQQCINETRKKWSDKKEKENYKENYDYNYNNNKEEDKEEDNKYFPMLAHTYDPNTNDSKKNKITFPCYVQPKLDGLRCIMYQTQDNIIKCQSRTGAYFNTMSHITDELSLFFNKYRVILDGELYTDEMPFEELAGLIKKKKLSDSDREKLKFVKYHVYDIIDLNKTYSERNKDIQSKITRFKYIVSVPTYLSNTKEDVKEYFGQFIEKGYEGIMLRNMQGLYRCNYRSYDLQKYKEFKESEYEIIGFKEGEGRDKGTVIWICKTEKGREFNVRPRGTIEKRREFFNKGNKYIGKKLTVIYQELSELEIPRFPVGKAIRDDY
jgi:DNA ligase-1